VHTLPEGSRVCLWARDEGVLTKRYSMFYFILLF